MLQPVVRRPGAPRGETPIQWQWDRHDRLSVTSALTLAPQSRRLGLYWASYRHHTRAAAVVGFVRALRRALLPILDRWSVHGATRLRDFLAAHGRRIRLECLPAYPPDLNPVGQVWNHPRYSDLANLAPADVGELEVRVRSSMAQKRAGRAICCARSLRRRNWRREV